MNHINEEKKDTPYDTAITTTVQEEPTEKTHEKDVAYELTASVTPLIAFVIMETTIEKTHKKDTSLCFSDSQ